MNVAVHGPDEPGDVIEQGGPLMRLPAWARLPRWLPGPGGRVSRGAALFGLATLLIGLAAGYALGDRQAARTPRPAPPAAGQQVFSGPAILPGPAPSPGALDLFGLAQTGERPNRPQSVHEVFVARP